MRSGVLGIALVPGLGSEVLYRDRACVRVRERADADGDGEDCRYKVRVPSSVDGVGVDYMM